MPVVPELEEEPGPHARVRTKAWLGWQVGGDAAHDQQPDDHAAVGEQIGRPHLEKEAAHQIGRSPGHRQANGDSSRGEPQATADDVHHDVGGAGAKGHAQLRFADGFESGNTSAWSATTP